ncbi:MAG: hypothetical protein IT318_22395 [Anaerolineales bacterium]|nr:hypothetical protein [Anaerolineales bacterium]
MAAYFLGRRARVLIRGLAAVLALLAGMVVNQQTGEAPATEPAAQVRAPVPGPAAVSQLPVLAAGAQAAPASATLAVVSPTCRLPVPNTATCYIGWPYLYAEAAGPGQYMITMTVSIDDQLRAYVGGFFQSSMYIPNDMLAPGFRVACGAPGAGGIPELGASYRFLIQGRATGGGPVAEASGTVSCPADIVHLRLPMLSRP